MGIVSSFSSLTLMVMSPSLTNLDLANRIISAKAKTMTVNITIPKIISIPVLSYNWMPENDINAIAIR